jgi:hypothetical protein
MGYGDEKIVVDVRESDRGSIIYKDAAGKELTYYPTMTTGFTVEDLETFVILGEPPECTTGDRPAPTRHHAAVGRQPVRHRRPQDPRFHAQHVFRSQ